MHSEGNQERSAGFITRLLSIDTQTGTVSVDAETFTVANGVAALSTWLYGTLHTRNSADVNAMLHRDPALEERIALAAPDPGILVPAAVCSDVALPDPLVAVEVHRTVFAVPRDALFLGKGSSRVRLPSHRPALTPGFFMFIHELDEPPTAESPTRFYVPAEAPERAIELWSKIVPRLVESEFSFRAKVLSHSGLYPRADALVVYGRRDAHAIESCLIDLLEGSATRDVRGSLLARKITNSLYTAPSPRSGPGEVEQSFGEHRCKAIAEAVMLHIANPSAGFLATLTSTLEERDIDPSDIAAPVKLVDRVLS